MLNPKAKLTELNRANHALSRDPGNADLKARAKAAKKAFDGECAAVKKRDDAELKARRKEQAKRLADRKAEIAKAHEARLSPHRKGAPA